MTTVHFEDPQISIHKKQLYASHVVPWSLSETACGTPDMSGKIASVS